MQQVRKIFGSAAAPASIVASVIGFFTDVLQPLGDFAPWVALLSFICALVSLAGFVRLRRKPGIDALEHPLLGVLVFSSFFTVVFTAWSLIEAAAPPRGFVADNVAPIAQLQAQLLGLQADVTDIKKTTSASATVVASSATAQAQGFKDIQSAFAALSGQGSIVQNPKTPQEWYANARIYQLKGDTANAIKAYEGYFTFKLEFVDPYAEYSALLKATEGIARARQLIGDMQKARPDSFSLDLAYTKLLDTGAERLPRLAALAARAPQFGPAFLELGLEYDRALQGGLTSDLLKKEQEAYATLFKLEEQQGLTRFYIDKAAADKSLQDAKQSQAAYGQATKYAGILDIQTNLYANGVQFVVVLNEPNAQKMLFSIDDPQPKTETGKVSVGTFTGVNTVVGPVKLPVGEHTVYIQVIDANGVASPITSKKFKVDIIALNFNQQPLDFSTNTIPGIFTVGVLDFPPETIFDAFYSIDSDKLDQTTKIAAQSAISVKGLKPGDHKLYIRATSLEGKQVPMVVFPFTVK